MIWHFMQIVWGDNLHEVPYPTFLEKKKKKKKKIRNVFFKMSAAEIFTQHAKW